MGSCLALCCTVGMDGLIPAVLDRLLKLSCTATMNGLSCLSSLAFVRCGGCCGMRGRCVLGAGGSFYRIIGDFSADNTCQTATKETGKAISSFCARCAGSSRRSTTENTAGTAGDGRNCFGRNHDLGKHRTACVADIDSQGAHKAVNF